MLVFEIQWKSPTPVHFVTVQLYETNATIACCHDKPFSMTDTWLGSWWHASVNGT